MVRIRKRKNKRVHKNFSKIPHFKTCASRIPVLQKFGPDKSSGRKIILFPHSLIQPWIRVTKLSREKIRHQTEMYLQFDIMKHLGGRHDMSGGEKTKIRPDWDRYYVGIYVSFGFVVHEPVFGWKIPCAGLTRWNHAPESVTFEKCSFLLKIENALIQVVDYTIK